MQQPTLVIDNGGSSLKIGLVKQQVCTLPNAICKSKNVQGVFVGQDIETKCPNYAALSFKRPVDKGYLVDCETQAMIWKHTMDHMANMSTPISDLRLVLSRPPFQPPTLQNDTNEMVFEYFNFASCMCCTAQAFSFASMMPINMQIGQTRTALVVDSGFSFTHIVPIVDGVIQQKAIRRINIAGKQLTNYLKEIVSTRQYDMTDETFLMNTIKERMCYVSMDFLNDLKMTKLNDNKLNKIRSMYVLPDYATTKLGYVKQNNQAITADEQILVLNNERITVPELLFHPSDIGMNQAGVAETIVQSVEKSGCFSDEQKQLLYDSVILVGGSTKFPNFKDRVSQELRKFASCEYDIQILQPEDPITATWQGGCIFADIPNIPYQVTRKEYQEYGHEICKNRFAL